MLSARCLAFGGKSNQRIMLEMRQGQETHMVWNRLLPIVLLLVCGAILLHAATSSAAQETLQSF